MTKTTSKLILRTLALSMCCLLCLCEAVAQERVYVKDGYTFEPGSKTTQYLSVMLENAAENYVAYQMDIYLPAGLELAYYNGAPDIYIKASSPLYPKDDRSGDRCHQLTISKSAEFIRLMCVDVSGNRPLLARNGELFVIGVTTTSPYVKPGDVQVELKGVKLSNADAEGPTYTSIENNVGSVSTTSTVSIKVSATNRFSTCVFPFDVETLPAGLSAYDCTQLNGDNLYLTHPEKISAFTPYVLYAPNGFQGNISGQVDASKYKETVENGYLKGTVVSTQIEGSQGYYVMQNQGEGTMFYKVGDVPFTIPEGKCWLAVPQSSNARFVLDFGATGIGETENGKLEGANDDTYDLQGRKTNVTDKGIYILNGKKVVK